MAAVDEIDTAGLANTTNEDEIRKGISAMFWMWYKTHADQKVTAVKFWFISKTVRVRDLHGLFQLLFGPEQ
jgi:hypothetical protein